MVRMLFIAIIFAFAGCASITVCDKALKTRLEANRAPVEQKAGLEAKAAGLEDACAREREQSIQQQKDWNERNRKR